MVTGVRWDDPLGGLAVRDAAGAGARRLGIIPPSGTGVGLGECHASQVRYECLSGWSLASRYLAPSVRRLAGVSGVSPNDPEGLNVRSGPSANHPVRGSIPYDASGVVVHVCQRGSSTRSEWCLVTYGAISGWVAGRFLSAPGSVTVSQ